MEMKEILRVVEEIYKKKNEVDITDLYKAAGITAAEAAEFFEKMDADNLAEVIEIDMCCGVDYVIKGLTEKGKAMMES